MQTKDIIKQANIDWAVVGHNQYASKGAISSKIVMRNQATKVKLVSLTTYNDTSFVSDVHDHPRFVPTTEDRTKRYLVTDGQYYWVCPASSFIAPWDELEPTWAVREAEQAMRKAQEQAMAEAKQNAYGQAVSLKDSMVDSVRESIKHLLGSQASLTASVSLSVDGTYHEVDGVYRFDPTINGTVTLPYKDMMRLLEKLIEAQGE